MRATFRAVCVDVVRRAAGEALGEEWDAVGSLVPVSDSLAEEDEGLIDIARMYELDGEDMDIPIWG